MIKIYIDGKWFDREQAKVSVFDHGLLYGDGVFEGIRAYNGRIFKLHEHVERLFGSAKAIMLDIGMSHEQMEKIIMQAVKNNNLKDAYIRVLVTRGFGDLGLDMRKCKKPTIVVIADRIELFPEFVYEQGIKLVTSSLRRTPHQCLSPNIKSLNYLNNILARAEAARAGAQEALLLNMEGYVAECSGDNIFYLKKGLVKTPPVWAGILPGVTRQTVIDLLRDQLKITVAEDLFTVPDLYQAEEVFVTGTGAEIIGVAEIDERKIKTGKPGKLTKDLTRLYREYASTNGTLVYETNSVLR
ncbi:MAG: branched-chain-amino-acid transaminase [Elusimicrobia bacterium]|nr:branched-chain-amino-acid transaminase [Elusimicrobiota bacterium]